MKLAALQSPRQLTLQRLQEDVVLQHSATAQHCRCQVEGRELGERSEVGKGIKLTVRQGPRQLTVQRLQEDVVLQGTTAQCCSCKVEARELGVRGEVGR